jgi:hypothetical protein
VSGAVSYEIYRRAAPGSYSLIGTSSVPSYSDPTVTAGKAPALTAVLIKAIHMTELRTAINTLRALAGLSAFSFTDSNADRRCDQGETPRI